MKSVVGIEVPANRIGMECDKEDVEEVGGNELEASVQRRSCNWLAIDQYFVLDDDALMPKGGAVIVINARCLRALLLIVSGHLMNPRIERMTGLRE